MAYTNLPPNLYDMFSTINERLRKLESGPNQPGYTADAAQATAVYAQTQSTSALITANLAASQATIAQSQATIASSQAVAAQTSANGKNTIHYSSSTPSGSGTNVGDIWWQYSGSTLIGQWSWNGSSWNPAPITNAVISNLDAGKITTGILSAIEISAGSGTNYFHVSPTGYMSAQGVYVRGNITADSGTFTGSLYSSVGTIGGWTLSATRLSSTGSYLDSSTGDIAAAGNITSGGNISTSTGNINSANLLSGNTVQVNSGGAFNSYGSNRFDGVMYYGDGIIYSHPTTSASANVYVNPTAGSNYGTFARSTSSQKYKLEIQEQSIPLDSILSLTPKSYVDKAQAEEKGTTEGLQRYLGLIAEDVTLIPVLGSMLANLDSEGNPDSVNYDLVAVALIPLLKDHEARLNKLEGK